MYENSATFWRITHKISLGFDTVQIYVRLHRAILGKGGEFSLSREMSSAKQMIYTTINSFCIHSVHIHLILYHFLMQIVVVFCNLERFCEEMVQDFFSQPKLKTPSY